MNPIAQGMLIVLGLSPALWAGLILACAVVLT